MSLLRPCLIALLNKFIKTCFMRRRSLFIILGTDSSMKSCMLPACVATSMDSATASVNVKTENSTSICPNSSLIMSTVSKIFDASSIVFLLIDCSFSCKGVCELFKILLVSVIKLFNGFLMLSVILFSDISRHFFCLLTRSNKYNFSTYDLIKNEYSSGTIGDVFTVIDLLVKLLVGELDIVQNPHIILVFSVSKITHDCTLACRIGILLISGLS